MKIICEVVSASVFGDELTIRASGEVKNAPSYQPKSEIRFDVPTSKTNKKAFHVGRQFDLIVSLK